MSKLKHNVTTINHGSVYTRRDFLTLFGSACGILGVSSLKSWSKPQAAESEDVGQEGTAAGQLFPTSLKDRKWLRFSAAGFSDPVSGVVFRASNPPCCGLGVGGLGTGCIDIDVRGVYGFISMFNPISLCPAVKGWRMPRKRQNLEPLLGLSLGDRTWVLATHDIVNGGDLRVCQDPFFGRSAFKMDRIDIPKLENVRPANQVHYWGHYPVADVEFETDAPVSVALRAWSPFLPGDTAASNIPGAIFEVHLRNVSSQEQRGVIVFNFPGPDSQEARGAEFTRQQLNEDFHGVMVSSQGGVNYTVGVIGEENTRLGFGFGRNPTGWSKFQRELPESGYLESAGQELYEDSSASAAVDFHLERGQRRVVRFLLAWYALTWEGARREYVYEYNRGNGNRNPVSWLASKWSGDTNYYAHMYGARYSSSLDVARQIAREHDSLLRRVLAWQAEIYSDSTLPVWLQDSLINNLELLTEDSVWVQARPPVGDWAYQEGAYGLIESPRGDPDLACIPCDWYGNLPVVYFYPELALSGLKMYKHYQRGDGAAPFWVGILGDLPDFATPAYDWQVSLNGTCYVDLADRLWQRTDDNSVLKEFYDSLKKSNTYTMNLRKGPEAVISLPEGNKGMEWFEHGEWAGMCTHLGGLHLAQLRIMERMAQHMGDEEYVKQCRNWLKDGTEAMEEEMWTGGYYLNFYEKKTGKKSDDIMAYQLDGQWAARFHGLPGVFRADRVQVTLETIKRSNIALTPNVGAANFTRPDGSRLPEKDAVAAYGPYAMFPAEVLVLAMTYIYAGHVGTGLDLARRHWEALVCKHGHPWDMPNIVRGDTGERVYGTDYYQSMMLWALPAVLAGSDLKGCCKEGGLVDRVIKAGRGL
jgi:uncharacterized protein (DUF608 family)